MKKNLWYVAVVAVALLGLLWVQYYWIDYSIELRNEEFGNRVNQRLERVAEIVENDYHCFRFYSDFELEPGQGIYTLVHPTDEHNQFQALLSAQDSAGIDTVNSVNLDRSGQVRRESNKFRFDVPISIQMEINFRYLINEKSRESGEWSKFDAWVAEGYEHDINDPWTGELIVDTLFLDSILTRELKGLEVDNFYYGLVREDKDSLVWSKAGSDPNSLLSSGLGSTLFAGNKTLPNYKLFLQVPTREGLVLGGLWMTIATSAGVVLVVILLIAMFMRTIFHQRKLAEMKAGFISNMTHEFNTPVSNINLALDTFDRQLNNAPDGKVDQPMLMNIIREENNRLKDNLHIMLRSSLMQKNKLELSKDQVSLNGLVDRIAETYKFKLNGSGGKIHCDLQARPDAVWVDPVHFSNVIHNLLDNAVKYSGNHPEIRVSTIKEAGQLIMSISDRGIGMTRQELSRIFDQFYRAATGNRHDVKGFGLGLSYVKYILDNHGCRVTVDSSPGQGSTFKVFIPQNET